MNMSDVSSLVSPWDSLLNPTNVFAAELDQTPRKRGRPRKYFAAVEGKQKHRMDDKPVTNNKNLSHTVQNEMIEDCKRMVRENGHTAKRIVEVLAERYKLSYNQAHGVLKKFI